MIMSLRLIRGLVLAALFGILMCAGSGCRATAIGAGAPATSGGRQTTNINAFWKYQQGDIAGAEVPKFDDGAWQSYGLPHSFSMPYFAAPDFYVGYGWYRRHLSLPGSAAGKRVSLEFDGVFQDAEVFVNGKDVGGHQGGYTGFPIDITAAARPGDNLVAVRVNNIWNPRLAPRAGDHAFSGGIYRDVRVVVTDPLHVAWSGTFVTTPEVSTAAATASVNTDVVNDSGAGKMAFVRQEIVDPDGDVVATFAASQFIAAGATATVSMTSPEIKNPKLWHPDHPFLYALKTTVLEANRIADEYTTPFGIRTIKWTADQGFFLNGEHLYLRGANVHQDQAGWGDAVTDADAYRDVKLMKEAGFNFIRGSHYPHSPAFVDACDKLGILFWCENDFWSTATSRAEGYWNGSGYPTRTEDQAEFEASSKRQLTEMIRIHRNHPSIIVWSMCNEPFFSAGSVMPKVRTFLRSLVDTTHALDPTRPAAIGGVQRPTDANGRIDKIGDIAGYNGDGASIGAFQNPGIANMVSEYSSVSTDRPGKYDPAWGDLLRTPGIDRNVLYSWRLPWRSGESIWCGFDHGTIMGDRFGKMGLIDYFRIPKRSWYWYRNEYANVPPPQWAEPGTPAGLKLEADKEVNIGTDGTDDAWLLVKVLDGAGKAINNAPPVELSIVKGPGEFPTGPSISFDSKSDIHILDGEAAITIRSYYAGETVIRATSPGLAPADITLHFTGPVAWREGTTPAVKARPYVRYQRSEPSGQMQSFGHNSPVFPSSSLGEHSGAAADDGDARTYWQPAADDADPMLTVDLERFVGISRVRVAFTGDVAYAFKVEASTDQKQWVPLADLAGDRKASAAIDLPAPAGANGRFLRLHFQRAGNTPIQVSEVEVIGTLQNR